MQKLGPWGEAVAWQHYQAQGYHLLARNWRPPDPLLHRLELDLVLLHPTRAEWVVVEVKTRRSALPPDPLTVLPPAKLKALRRATEVWLSIQPEPWLPLSLELALVTSSVSPAIISVSLS